MNRYHLEQRLQELKDVLQSGEYHRLGPWVNKPIITFDENDITQKFWIKAEINRIEHLIDE